VLAPIPGPALAAGLPHASTDLLHRAQANPEQALRVIVKHAGQGHSAEAVVAAKGGVKVKDVAGVGFVAQVKGQDLADLASAPGVEQVEIDAPVVSTVAPGDSPIDAAHLDHHVYPAELGAPEVWASGITGRGIGVAVVDTGIQDLPDFADPATGASRVVARVAVNPNATDTADEYGHGTLVAGVVAGDSWPNPQKGVEGKYLGVAPGANLIDVKVSDDRGQAYTSDVINGIEWAIAHRQEDNIRVMNLSLEASVPESYHTSLLDAAVEHAWFSGILVVVAAGNGGPDSVLYPPANDPFVVTVGAVDMRDVIGRGDSRITPWSGYGTTQDGFAKPDAVAPGRRIVGPLASRSAVLANEYPKRIVDGDYIRFSGTSLAAPVVAGVGALAFQAHPTWTNDQVKTLLVQTAFQLGKGDPRGKDYVPYPGQGAGVVNAAAVVGFAGAPSPANDGLTISQHLVGPDGAVTYTTSSWSTSSWSTSSWSTSSWSTSSWSTSSWSTSSWSDTGWPTSSWSAAAQDD
jgi:serine protease AprX